MRPSAAALLIAHRGESREAPENTLAAINLAWTRGALAVEIDVRMTADGAMVVSHDPDTRRIRGPRHPIAKQTLAELRSLDAGAWKHRRWAGERMPLLREALATVPPRGRLFVEMKEGPATVPPTVKDVQSAWLSPRQVLVMSFVPETVAAAARALPENEVVLLLRARDYTARGAWKRVLAKARDLGARGVNAECHHALDAAKIAAAHDAGFTVYTWTVNRVATARRLATAGIDGITTDRCAWMRERLDHQAESPAPANVSGNSVVP